MTSEDVEPTECPECETQFLQEVDLPSFPVAEQQGKEEVRYFQCTNCSAFSASVGDEIVLVKMGLVSPEDKRDVLGLL